MVFNNVYGWHYSNLQSLGIWRSAHIEGQPAVALVDPFMRTVDAADGIAELALKFEGEAGGWSGTLRATIAPDNFEGQSYSVSKRITSNAAQSRLQFELADSGSSSLVARRYGRAAFVPGYAIVHAR